MKDNYLKNEWLMPCGVSFPSIYQHPFNSRYIYNFPDKSTAHCPSDLFIISSTEN